MTTKKANDYTCQSQQRILRLVMALAGNEYAGLTPSDLAKSTGATASSVTRDLHNLKLAGMAEEMPDASGRWRLGPKLVNLALAYLNCRDLAESRLKEMTNRYSKKP